MMAADESSSSGNDRPVFLQSVVSFTPSVLSPGRDMLAQAGGLRHARKVVACMAKLTRNKESEGIRPVMDPKP